MATSQRGRAAVSAGLAGSGATGYLPDLPPISALFLIDFDVKAGYTIIWKQAIPGLELEGVVEYKSLPSGLHMVPDDLVYFVHDEGYAGLSAFVNSRTDEEESRRARMIAVGILVPLSYGRLGRAWRHAENLKSIAAKLAADRKQTEILEEYWEKNGTHGTRQEAAKDSPLNSPALSFIKPRPGPKGHTRNRSASDGTALIAPGHRLSPFHPAWSLTNLLDTFGPLIFPLHRAALLRQRILISTHAPVHEACNFVYDISILANIPFSVFDRLDPSAPAQRLRPLYAIGIHDIPSLIQYNATSQSSNATAVEDDDTGPSLGGTGAGWIACTADSILAMKDHLWDVLITMPPPHSVNARDKVWPTVESPKGVQVKATQRDLRRYRSLKAGLKRVAAANAVEDGEAISRNSTDAPRRQSSSSCRRPSTSSTRAGLFPDQDSLLLANAAEKIVEPMTWAALAYSGFMWWASAGEQRRSDEAEESTHDATLLADLAPPCMLPITSSGASPSHQRRSSSFNAISATGAAPSMVDSVTSLTARRSTVAAEEPVSADEVGEERTHTELAIITYFHRLTAQLLGVLADVVESSDDDDMLDVASPGSGDDEDDALLHPGEGEYEDDASGFVRVDSDALANMGLDVWSSADAAFVREAVARYFDRRAYVEGKGVEVCGLRVC